MKKMIGFFIVVAIFILAVYHALVYYDNNFRYGRMRETPAVRPYEEPLLVEEAGLVPVDGGEEIYRVSAGIALMPPINMSQPAVIARGKAVYRIYCAQCHGLEGKGDGPNVSKDFPVSPRDFTNAEEMNKLSDADLKNVILDGGPAVSKSAMMPPWSKTLSEAEVDGLIQHLRKLCACEGKKG